MTDQPTTTHRTDEELLASLDAAPSGPGADWQPEPGDTIIGNVVRFEHPETKKDKRILPIVVLEVERDGAAEELRVAVKHKILGDELLDAKVQVGDRVAIRFLGQPEGKSYYKYLVRSVPIGPRDESQRFTLEPISDLDPDALAAEDQEQQRQDQESLTW